MKGNPDLSKVLLGIALVAVAVGSVNVVFPEGTGFPTGMLSPYFVVAIVVLIAATAAMKKGVKKEKKWWFSNAVIIYIFMWFVVWTIFYNLVVV